MRSDIASEVCYNIYRPIHRLLCWSFVCVNIRQSATLDHYGSGGWGPPTPSSGPRWGPMPGSSSSTPGPPPVMDSPYRITCPVHSPYRFRFANGGPDYYGHQVGLHVELCRSRTHGSKGPGFLVNELIRAEGWQCVRTLHSSRPDPRSAVQPTFSRFF
jgi:hypothetical protein